MVSDKNISLWIPTSLVDVSDRLHYEAETGWAANEILRRLVI